MNATDKRIIDLLKGEPNDINPYHHSILWNTEYYYECSRHLKNVDAKASEEHADRAAYYSAKQEALVEVVSEKAWDDLTKSEWWRDCLYDADTNAWKTAKEIAREKFDDMEFLLREEMRAYWAED